MRFLLLLTLLFSFSAFSAEKTQKQNQDEQLKADLQIAGQFLDLGSKFNRYYIYLSYYYRISAKEQAQQKKDVIIAVD